MKNKTNTITLAVSAFTFGVSPLFAEPAGHVDEVPGGSATYDVNSPDARTVNDEIKSFSTEDAEAKESANQLKAQLNAIRNQQGFKSDTVKSLNAYVAKHEGWGELTDNSKELPKNWEQNLEPGSVMPMDVYQASKALPKDVTTKIPTPPGVEDIIIEDSLFRIDSKSHVIIDIFTPSTNIS